MDTERFSDRPLQGQPATSAHKMIGTLNLIFASVLLLCGLCSGGSMLMQVAVAPMTQEAMQQGLEAQAKLEHQNKIDAIKAREDVAVSDEEKEKLTAAREALESQEPAEPPLAGMMDDMNSMYRNPTLIGYTVTDFATGLLLNMLMFASGIGLLAAKPWGRKLGVGVAILKLARLILVYGFAIFFVVPAVSEKMGDMVGKAAEQAQKQQPQRPNQPPLPQMDKTIKTVYNVMGTTSAVLMIVFGSIYPIIMWRVLTRPKVKLACGEAVSADPTELS